MPLSICTSIVIFESDPALLRRTLEALDVALARAQDAALVEGSDVTLVDNDAPAGNITIEPFAPGFAPISKARWLRRSGQGNVGFGRGHNLVLNGSEADLYLVLNPDALLSPHALARGIEYLVETEPCGLVAPYTAGPDGAPQFLCKRYPDVLTLFLRAAMPRLARRCAPGRMERYELRDIVGQDSEAPATGVPLASGCCMLMRADIVRRTGGFDPRFFVYFEDYDLSLRLAQDGAFRIDYVPAMRIVHHGGNAAKKSPAHVRMFAAGAYRFFDKHGWKLA
jgi:GT2 family glycosyltransferase